MQFRHRALLVPATGDLCSASAARAGSCVDAFGYSEEADYTTPFTGIDVSAVPDYDEGNYDFEGKNDTNFWGASLTLDWTVGDYVITSITSYDDMEDFQPADVDSSPNDTLTGAGAVDQQSFSQELRVNWEGDQ